jgi:hypothetical protein
MTRRDFFGAKAADRTSLPVGPPVAQPLRSSPVAAKHNPTRMILPQSQTTPGKIPRYLAGGNAGGKARAKFSSSVFSEIAYRSDRIRPERCRKQILSLSLRVSRPGISRRRRALTRDRPSIVLPCPAWPRMGGGRRDKPGDADHAKSKRSRFITLVQAATKS